VFDGHGGYSCAEFLKENLHKFVIKDPEFPENPKQALINGFREAEEVFTKTALSGEEVEKSGSCCLVILIVDKICYIANVGDSRAIASFDCGSIIQAVTRDHKPSLPSEKQRIINAGGKLYQSQITNAKG
jgi:protein phosphatase 2C family protein 2/3